MTRGKRRGGAWRRLIETIARWENAMDYTPCDYALDRIGNLEREVALLRDKLTTLPVVDTAGTRIEPAVRSPAEAL